MRRWRDAAGEVAAAGGGAPGAVVARRPGVDGQRRLDPLRHRGRPPAVGGRAHLPRRPHRDLRHVAVECRPPRRRVRGYRHPCVHRLGRCECGPPRAPRATRGIARRRSPRAVGRPRGGASRGDRRPCPRHRPGCRCAARVQRSRTGRRSRAAHDCQAVALPAVAQPGHRGRCVGRRGGRPARRRASSPGVRRPAVGAGRADPAIHRRPRGPCFHRRSSSISRSPPSSWRSSGRRSAPGWRPAASSASPPACCW